MNDNEITAIVGWPTEPEMAKFRKVAAAAVAAERERWAETFARQSAAIAQHDAPMHRGYKLALSDMAEKMRA